MVPRAVTLVALAAALLAQSATADSYRCGRRVVRDGDSVERLLRLCGPPRHRDHATETVQIDGRYGPERVQRWYYRKSRRSLEYVVMVHDGRIVAIDARR